MTHSEGKELALGMTEKWVLSNLIIEGSLELYIRSPDTHSMPKERASSIRNHSSGGVLQYRSMKRDSENIEADLLSLT